MPIHDQGYRRYGGTRDAARPRVAGDRARPACATMLAQARSSSGLLLFAWVPFVVRAVQIYAADELPAGRVPRARRPRRSASSSSSRSSFVFFITIYVGAGLIANDRRANALQIYLSKPLTRVGVHRRQARRSCFAFLLFVTWVPAHAAAARADRCSPAASRSCGRTCSCSRRSRCSSLLQVLVASFTMLALSSLSKSSRFVGILYAGVIFFTQRDPRHVLGDHRDRRPRRWSRRSASTSPRSATSIFRVAAALRRRRWPLSLARDRRRCVAVVRSWCSSAACAAWRWSRDAATPAGAPIVQAEHLSKWYGQVIGLNDVTVVGAARHHRAARPERRRQVHVHEAR